MIVETPSGEQKSMLCTIERISAEPKPSAARGSVTTSVRDKHVNSG